MFATSLPPFPSLCVYSFIAGSVLHLLANSRRIFQAPLYYSSTNFCLKNLWDVDLTKVDVVAVYGLHPIMKDLGVKMKNELKPGSIVLSNVFSIPGWKSSTLSRDGMHIYMVPDCWEQSNGQAQVVKTRSGTE